MADATPTLYPNASFQRISADGRYIVSDLLGTVVIYDLVEGTAKEFSGIDEDGNETGAYYSIGLGNRMTADGSILLGATTENNAAYLQNGEWHLIDVPNPEQTNICHGITPDGSRICGNVGLNAMTMDEVIMQAPAYWDRNADGNGYGKYNMLPYPTQDFFGEKPQYVTAVCISDDGKTIVGQMVFSSGMMAVPILYKQDNDGEWSYSFPTQSLFNPNGLEPVENPGDGPAGPRYEDFMTEEEIAAYNAAVDAYYEDYTVGYPEYENYMTDDEKAAYQAAYAKYQEEYAAWETKYNAYQDYFYGVIESSPNFTFNNIFLSTDGKQIVSTVSREDPNGDPMSWFPVTIETPCTIDIASNSYNPVDTDLSCTLSGVADNGVILAFNGVGQIPMVGYVIKDGNVQPIDEYISQINPSYGEWIKKNMSHELVVDYDKETWEEIFAEVTYTGMPIATPDMSTIAIWNDCPWDYEAYAEGVVFDMNMTAGIGSVTVGVKNLSLDENGNITVPEGFASVEIYSISGVCVKSVASPAGTVKLDLGNGIYIAKGTRTDGSISVLKIAHK